MCRQNGYTLGKWDGKVKAESLDSAPPLNNKLI